jgi:hypothetical protein
MIALSRPSAQTGCNDSGTLGDSLWAVEVATTHRVRPYCTAPLVSVEYQELHGWLVAG